MRPLLSLICVGLASGCGVLLDLDPPDDASAPGLDAALADAGVGDGGGMDAARPDAGPPVECSIDETCGDDSFCNGAERCDLGACVAGRPVSCDDGVRCTVDECDEASRACGHRPDATLCPTPDVVCLSATCDPALGCVVERDDTACDDGVHCTVDRCGPTGCEHVPRDALCAAGEYCAVSPDAGGSPGCVRIPDCSTDAECPALQCNGPGRCEGGVCTYSPITLDPTCTDPDPCLPVFCDEGTCRTGTRTVCPASDPNVCTVEECLRNETGNTVTCASVPRTGACSPSAPCSMGTCMSGTCVETSICSTPADACYVSTCTGGGGCADTPVACGANATCLAGAGGPVCACNPGYERCEPTDFGCACLAASDAGTAIDAGRRDAGATGTADAGGRDAGFDAGDLACTLGRMDCDMNGSCECRGLLSRCLAGRCECLLTCGLGQVCCRDMMLGIGYCGRASDCSMPP
ncbi:MAG: hypothetical protein H6719_13125 [Sandaracinaceae bacterium]|nr:hypothetical protein [Sandaracinaceae bacterium]